LNAQSGTFRREPWLLQIYGARLVLPCDCDSPLSARVAVLDEDTIAEFKHRDLHVLALPRSDCLAGILGRAADFIGAAPELESVVRRCVHEIILLQSPDNAYDISHSEPRWATRIFISIPAPSTVGELRVAEAIVHEAMHLNLTFFERNMQLVARPKLLPSPWKTELRPASGVLHGLYVFVCIYRFFEHVSQQVPLDDQGHCHVEKRFAEIWAEIDSIDRSALLDCLTPDGVSLAKDLFGSIAR
jgi:HEXXH motif-containing protein